MNTLLTRTFPWARKAAFFRKRYAETFTKWRLRKLNNW